MPTAVAISASAMPPMTFPMAPIELAPSSRKAVTLALATTGAQQPELLAMHLAEGNEAEAAAPHWLEAARAAWRARH